MNRPHIIVSSEDFEQLGWLIEQQADGRAAALAEALDEELSRAQVVRRAELPRGVVSMNGTVLFHDEAAGERREVKLCYPQDATGGGRLSVLSPIGTALLGLSVGQTIEWPVHGGGHRRLTILEVRAPEHAGAAASP